MKIKKYIKRPVPIEAVLLTEDTFDFILNWLKKEGIGCSYSDTGEIFIHAPFQYLKAEVGKHYITKGVLDIDGLAIFPIEKGIFERTYKED
ncbi:hypothetical protein [Persephonella sp.]